MRFIRWGSRCEKDVGHCLLLLLKLFLFVNMANIFYSVVVKSTPPIATKMKHFLILPTSIIRI